jgi:hypothetical protein
METVAEKTLADYAREFNALVAEYNALTHGAPKRTVNRMRNKEEAQRRIEMLESDLRALKASERAVAKEETEAAPPPPIVPESPPAAPVVEAQETEQEDDMAKKKKRTQAKAQKSAAKRTRARSANGTSIKAKTEEFNSLVPKANRAGHTNFRHHTSDFGSHDAADKQLKRIRAAIEG